jgi:MoaA/NifB/PqqE/SkfB family radical SAM enzyme
LSYLMLETNSSCNLQCTHCSREHMFAAGLRDKKNLTVKELRFILDQVQDCPIDTIKFQGLSEPMLHPHFAELSEVLRSYFPKAFVAIATNLQYNVKKSPLLKTLPFVDLVNLSIDGIGPTYERIRKGANYEKLLTALDDLDWLVSDQDRRKLYINFTLTPGNYSELEEIYGLKALYGLAGVRINLAQHWIEGETNPHVFTPDILKYVKRYKNDVKGVAGWDFKNCFWPFSGVVLDVFGNVRQCVINTSQAPIGNVFQQPLREIFNFNPVFLESRQLLKSNCPPEQCLTCDYKNLAPQLTQVLGGKFKVNKPREAVEHATQY